MFNFQLFRSNILEGGCCERAGVAGLKAKIIAAEIPAPEKVRKMLFMIIGCNSNNRLIVSRRSIAL